MIHFRCACGHQFLAPEGDIGKLVECPNCRRCLLVPAEGTKREDAVQDSIRPDLAESEERGALPRELGDQAPVSGLTGTSGKAKASLVLGILSLFLNVLTALPAILFAIQALGNISGSRGRIRGRGLAFGRNCHRRRHWDFAELCGAEFCAVRGERFCRQQVIAEPSQTDGPGDA